LFDLIFSHSYLCVSCLHPWQNSPHFPARRMSRTGTALRYCITSFRYAACNRSIQLNTCDSPPLNRTHSRTPSRIKTGPQSLKSTIRPTGLRLRRTHSRIRGGEKEGTGFTAETRSTRRKQGRTKNVIRATCATLMHCEILFNFIRILVFSATSASRR
jgi:hypothetical protein